MNIVEFQSIYPEEINGVVVCKVLVHSLKIIIIRIFLECFDGSGGVLEVKPKQQQKVGGDNYEWVKIDFKTSMK